MANVKDVQELLNKHGASPRLVEDDHCDHHGCKDISPFGELNGHLTCQSQPDSSLGHESYLTDAVEPPRVSIIE